MNLSAIKASAQSAAGLKLLVVRKHSPKILFAAGVIGVVGTAVLASRATLKLSDRLETFEDAKLEKKTIREADPQVYSAAALRSDMTVLHMSFLTDVVKLYGPTVVVGAASIAALTGSHVILTRRNAQLGAAFASATKALESYRARVVADQGEEKDREYFYGKQEVEVISTNEKGKEKVKKENIAADTSMYAQYFDASNANFHPTPSFNTTFLRGVQRHVNYKLHSEGYVSLNEVYSELGLSKTSAGYATGWVLGGPGDDYIDFKIWADKDQTVIDPFFVNPHTGAILLDFNVAGETYQLLDQVNNGGAKLLKGGN